jgi:hypothetical protein
MSNKKSSIFKMISLFFEFVLLLMLLLQNPIFLSKAQQYYSDIYLLSKYLNITTANSIFFGSTILYFMDSFLGNYQFDKSQFKKMRRFFIIYGALAYLLMVCHIVFIVNNVLDLVILALYVIFNFLFKNNISHFFTLELTFNTGNKMDKIKSSFKKIETEDSFNIKTNQGWLNILAPFRGILLIGTAGSGKTYSVIEPIIDQSFQKDYSAFIYDFKFPNLAAYSYNSYVNNYVDRIDKKGILPEFNVIYFRDIKYSNRCNPLDPSFLKEKAFALQAAKTILFNINPEWAKKQGEFFSTSAIAICQGLIWFLRNYSINHNIKFSTLPHVIEMISFRYNSMVVEVLIEDIDVASIITPVKTAIVANAKEQLAGQIGSLQVGLSQLVDKKMYYVMSDSNISLDINNPEKPRILILGNDDELKSAYAPALSLYASTLINTINQKHKRKTLFCADEFPTLVIPGIDNLPNTGRSNKVCTFIGLQNFYQSEKVYGKAESSVINSSFANIIIGQGNDRETAKTAQELLGEYEYTQRNLSLQIEKEGGSQSLQVAKRKVIELNDVFELNQGEFVGKLADAGEGQEKKFFAKFLIEKQPYKHNLPYINKELANLSDNEIEKILNDNTLKIKNEIETMIVNEYFTHKINKKVKNNKIYLNEINALINEHIEPDHREVEKDKVYSHLIKTLVGFCIENFYDLENSGVVVQDLEIKAFLMTVAEEIKQDRNMEPNVNSPIRIIHNYFSKYSVFNMNIEEADNNIYEDF